MRYMLRNAMFFGFFASRVLASLSSPHLKPWTTCLDSVARIPNAQTSASATPKSHRHRPTRQVPAVSLALLPHLPRPVPRTQGYPAVPRPFRLRTRSSRSSNTSTRAVVSSRRRAWSRSIPIPSATTAAPPARMPATRTTNWWPTRLRPASSRWMRSGRSLPEGEELR